MPNLQMVRKELQRQQRAYDKMLVMAAKGAAMIEAADALGERIDAELLKTGFTIDEVNGNVPWEVTRQSVIDGSWSMDGSSTTEHHSLL